MGVLQHYIGTPNGIVLCVDELPKEGLCGSFYHFYSRDGIAVNSMEELLFRMEELFDDINFPHPSTNRRAFLRSGEERGRRKEREKMVKEEELLQRHGDIGTFIIRVQHRQNSSWQGRITWSDRGKTVYFRSVWEMVRLIAEALNTVSKQERESTEVTWEEE